MSALRYCGAVRIRVTYLELRQADTRAPNGSYRCHITCGADSVTQYVGAPLCLSGAVDSPEAFDSAAHAALSFTEVAASWITENADYTDQGWAIRRKP